MTEETTQTQTRGSSDVWLQAAKEALLQGGVEAVKVQLLARSLNLSRASFYWFFTDRDELLAALLAEWREKNTGNIMRRAGAYADSLAEAILNVCDCWFDDALFDARFEFAIRSWALQSPEVLAEVQKADATRIGALTAMFERFGRSSLSAGVRARAIYLVQIGYISMQTQEDLALRMSRMAEYVEVYTGRVAEPRELARFFSRHGFTAQEVVAPVTAPAG